MIPRILLLLSILFGVVRAEAASDDQLAAIRALGSLNGVALQCGRVDQTQRIKQVLVNTLPKQRQLGELFDYQTNKSFMAFINDNRVCPSTDRLKQQVDLAIEKLNAVYQRP
ncbi:MAG: hypothetical protein JAY99_03765 [Candidatus Thiodiazotropha lotti]|uniref:Secreted protein n=1 Tax=Candidatus Thiodiazotropha endoloripes TaxID=1818881 RepID=A0A1E2ULH2_9GAMM|nr:hypothetical protein [Candidatus Thiodiazotropha endoloripes]MCG7899429.1 hypothetical protein [Candidatus Thiodiazotropha weberae]MCG7992115.1 hypothetical protein [Candidatus Thiodiazotropha lotti]MCG7903967.1 hypothetical protein [Candidatus Thiodiazotropha weberae]MCG7915524.1 hypothetical protein [Candidatus Thiodiazotropha weberae]MCG7998619.1 hypothetical protein [Candidatus Thiodiazotropha lotti]